jgi:hypothetical protein
LGVVGVNIPRFGGCYRWQDERWSEAPRQPRQRARAKTRRNQKSARAFALEMIAPKLRVCAFDGGELLEDLGEMRIWLGFRQSCVKCGAVNLALEIEREPFDVGFILHCMSGLSAAGVVDEYPPTLDGTTNGFAYIRMFV